MSKYHYYSYLMQKRRFSSILFRQKQDAFLQRRKAIGKQISDKASNKKRIFLLRNILFLLLEVPGGVEPPSTVLQTVT